MAFITALGLLPNSWVGKRSMRCTRRQSGGGWRVMSGGAMVMRHEQQVGGEGESGKDGNQAQENDERDWRPHSGDRLDVDEDTPTDIPVELAEGYLQEGGVRPKLDLDADEVMLMWKVRRMLHEEDYKRIFENPRVGEL